MELLENGRSDRVVIYVIRLICNTVLKLQILLFSKALTGQLYAIEIDKKMLRVKEGGHFSLLISRKLHKTQNLLEVGTQAL